MKYAYFTLLVLVLMSAGCASLPTDRFVSVETSSSGPGGITPAAAIDLFYMVANKLGLNAKGPIQDSRNPHSVEYSAETTEGEVASQIRFILTVDKDRIEFISSVYGKQADRIHAEKAAAIIERALDEHGTKYKIRKGSDPMFWGS
jgi:hypothetical protein